MYHSHVSGKRVVAAKRLFLGTELAPHLELAGVVDRIFVTSQIVGSREDRVARLSSRWVDALTTVRTSLRVAKSSIAGDQVTPRRGLTVGLALVTLELRRTLEAKGAAVVGASVGTRIRGGVSGPRNREALGLRRDLDRSLDLVRGQSRENIG